MRDIILPEHLILSLELTTKSQIVQDVKISILKVQLEYNYCWLYLILANKDKDKNHLLFFFSLLFHPNEITG